MPKEKVIFICNECSAEYIRWQGQCNKCGGWNTIIENISIAGSADSFNRVNAKANVAEKPHNRISSGINGFDIVLGGGIMPGSLTLLAGDPGIGKSTLLLSVADNVSAKHKTLYVSGEETSYQVADRATRLGLKHLEFDIINTNSLERLKEIVETEKPDLVIIDSIQTFGSGGMMISTINKITHTSSQILSIAKTSNTAFMIVGHITKSGSLAGPKALEHLVDTVLYFTGDSNGTVRYLKSLKNRFGSTGEIIGFEMTSGGLIPVDDISKFLMAEKQDFAGSVFFALKEAQRPLILEVQALTATTGFGFAKRSSSGAEISRVNMLVAILSKRANMSKLSSYDVYVNIIGGVKVIDPGLDLAIILAIMSSYFNYIIPSDYLVLGEVGLGGEIRKCSYMSDRINEAKKYGIKNIIGPSNYKNTDQDINYQGFGQIKDILSWIKTVKGE